MILTGLHSLQRKVLVVAQVQIVQRPSQLVTGVRATDKFARSMKSAQPKSRQSAFHVLRIKHLMLDQLLTCPGL
jgi:exonuclease I